MGFEPIVDSGGALAKMIVRAWGLLFNFRLMLISDQGPRVAMCTVLNETRAVGRSGSWPSVRFGVPDRGRKRIRWITHFVLNLVIYGLAICIQSAG